MNFSTVPPWRPRIVLASSNQFAIRAPHRLGVAGLPQRRGAHDVGEQDGDRLPHLAGRGGLHERPPTGPTEAEPVRVLLAALSADQGHERERRGRNPVISSGCQIDMRFDIRLTLDRRH